MNVVLHHNRTLEIRNVTSQVKTAMFVTVDILRLLCIVLQSGEQRRRRTDANF